MQRYKVKGDCLVLPPVSSVDAHGHAVTNFAARIARDADFAAANGYWSRGEGVDTALPPVREDEPAPAYVLIDGVWQIAL